MTIWRALIFGLPLLALPSVASAHHHSHGHADAYAPPAYVEQPEYVSPPQYGYSNAYPGYYGGPRHHGHHHDAYYAPQPPMHHEHHEHHEEHEHHGW